MIVAIDGPSGVGKSTVGQAVAEALGLVVLDTGALYRGAALLAIEAGVAVDDGAAVARLIESSTFEFRSVEGERHLFIDGRDVATEIRTPRISEGASKTSAQPEVRQALLDLQRELGRRTDTLAEGRDIGTVVFPDADFKFFLDAEVETRVQRRRNQYEQSGRPVDDEALRRDIVERDERDTSRAHAPLKAASDAVHVDTTKLTFEEVVATIVETVRGV